jgi:hypothetical protein
MDKTTFEIMKSCFKANPQARPTFASLSTEFERLIRENGMKAKPVRDIGATIKGATVQGVPNAGKSGGGKGDSEETYYYSKGK